MSLETFNRRIRLRANNIPREVNKIVRTIALVVDQSLVLRTPVDTGRARSGWVVSLNEPSTETPEPFNPLPRGTDPEKFGEGANARGAIAQGREVIGRRRPEQTLYIVNNNDYIDELNRGSSAQAPEMFVEMAIQDGLNAVSNVTIDTSGR